MIRQTLKALGVFFIVAALFSCSLKPTPRQAVDYSNKIVDIQAKAITSVDDIISVFGGTAQELQATHKIAVEKAEKALDGIKELGPFEAGNTAFYDAAIKYLTLHKQVLELEYREIVNILGKEEVGSEDFSTVEKLMKEAENKYAKGDEEFQEAQVKFSKEYGFQIAD